MKSIAIEWMDMTAGRQLQNSKITLRSAKYEYYIIIISLQNVEIIMHF